MGLNVTVSKGHDFTTGNVTRAALNAGATPTIAVTGSVGESEIASGAITNAKVKTNADIAVDKLALASGKIIIGAANGNASALSGTSSFSSVASETEGNAGLLVDVGDKFEVLKTNTLAVSTDDINDSKQYLNGDSVLSIHKVTTSGENPVTTNNLRIKHVTNSVHGNHISTANALDGASIGKNSAGKLEVKDGGIHHQKLYPYKNAAGTQMPGFLVYGASGAATVLEAKSDPCIPVTVSASGTPIAKVYRKSVNLGKFNNSNQNGQGWIRAEHGIGTGSTVPTHVGIMLACVAASGAGVAAHGYTIGDRIYLGGGVDLTSPGSSPLQRGIKTHCDGTYVTVVINGASDIKIPKKHGGATPDNSTHFGTNVDTVIWSNIYTYFNVVAVVSE